MRRRIAAGGSLGAALLVCGSAMGAYTTVLPGPETPLWGNDGLGTGATATNVLPALYPGSTITRINDTGGSILNLHTNGAGADDRNWKDGTTRVQFQVKYAGFNNIFGWYNNNTNTYTQLVDGQPGGLPGSVTVSLSSNFQWTLDPNGSNNPANYFYSDPANNTDGNVDHFVTYRITGGALASPVWVVACEDLAGGGDQDYNDMVVEIRAVPLPQEAAMAGLGLIGMVSFRSIRRRRA